MQFRTWLAVVVLCLTVPGAVFAMTSANYQINWDSLNSGGDDISNSANYRMQDTIGEQATGLSNSENYQISAGYRLGSSATPFLSILVRAQENAVKTTWSTFSNSGKTVVVANAGLFIVGDYLGIIENEGFGEKVAIGKISLINGSTITVDAWEGEPGDLSAVPDGNGDVAYRLNGRTADLGTVYFGTEHEALSFSNVDTNAGNGYTVSVQGTGSFTNGTHAMDDVLDGVVSLQSEEYGAESIGSIGYATGTDLAIPTASQRVIATSTQQAVNQRIGLLYKVSVTPATPTGNYSQTVMYRVTGNF
ncbi:MAG: hypothetical protein WC477_06720 [Patescibacteria group bacterium]